MFVNSFLINFSYKENYCLYNTENKKFLNMFYSIFINRNFNLPCSAFLFKEVQLMDLNYIISFMLLILFITVSIKK